MKSIACSAAALAGVTALYRIYVRDSILNWGASDAEAESETPGR